MPPKTKISRDDIINTAMFLCRKYGTKAINARNIAKELKSSTQPIFSNFSTMEDLQNQLNLSAYTLYLNFLKEETKRGEYPLYKSYGMAYIRFAKEEKELFKMLFMCDRKSKELTETEDFEESVKIIMEANGIDEKTARLIHLELWIWVHGVAVMIASSFLNFDSKDISDMLSDVYHGIKHRHLQKED